MTKQDGTEKYMHSALYNKKSTTVKIVLLKLLVIPDKVHNTRDNTETNTGISRIKQDNLVNCRSGQKIEM